MESKATFKPYLQLAVWVIYINILFKEYNFTDNRTLIPKLKELSPIFNQEAKNRIKNAKTYKLSNYEYDTV